MRVKIKTWDQMVGEFGIISDKLIPCKGDFVISMERQIPGDRIIEVYDSTKNNILLTNLDFIWKTPFNTWEITDDMIEDYIVEE